MHAPLFLRPQIMHWRLNRLRSIFDILTGVFGVTIGPGIHIAQLKCTHSYRVSVQGIVVLSSL